MAFTSSDVHHDTCGWHDYVDHGMSNRLTLPSCPLPLCQKEYTTIDTESVFLPCRLMFMKIELISIQKFLTLPKVRTHGAGFAQEDVHTQN